MLKAFSLHIPRIGSEAQNKTQTTFAQKKATSFSRVVAVPIVKMASRKNHLPWFKVSLTSLILVNVMAMLTYFFGINMYAAKGYEIKQLHKKIDSLTTEQQKLSLKAAEFSSLTQVQAGIQTWEFVPVTQTEFVRIKSPALTLSH